MKQSQLFTKTKRESPKEEVALNAKLLIRAGYVYKEYAGVYTLLPLGKMVADNITKIIRQEMNDLGAQEVQMSSLQDSSPWKTTNRWDDAVVDNWFKTKLKNDTELGLAFTHEDPLTRLMKDFISSYRDLPKYVYQFQTKFRNELRVKSGILRGREFIMKDMYSFSKDENSHNEFYEKTSQAYERIFEKLGIGQRTYKTFASGGLFSKYSHEFQMITDAGEDTIYVDEKNKIAVNKEVYNDEVLAELKLKKEDLVEKKSIEVGNIFSLGTKFSKPLELTYTKEDGKKEEVIMGSYGIGISRLVGAIAEATADEGGLIWPVSVSPFAVHLVPVLDKDGKIKEKAERLYQDLSKDFTVLYDDRDERAGEKFADSDLMGIPVRIILSDKLEEEGLVEIKYRQTGQIEKIPHDQITRKIQEANIK